MSTSPSLAIGERLDGAGEAQVLARRLNRHTFWCGQSGSGKTYALGVLLERVLVGTHLPIVVLDPNSDFVSLGQVRDHAPDEIALQLGERDIRILRSAGDDAVRVRFANLSQRARAAVLQLDPVQDIEEFNALIRVSQDAALVSRGDVIGWMRSTGDPKLERAAMRVENLGVAAWPLWAWGDSGVDEILADRADATVIDLGGFSTPEEPKAVALAALDYLWEHRAQRTARMVVIDEAHNLCPPDPSTPLERMLVERIVQIAAEGRKYGLWLVISTQRPSKVHPNVLSQCDNLVLMKMSSQRDLGSLADVFGHVPAELIDRARSFTQGQALFGGGFVAESQLVQVADRWTHEGGSDVAVPLR